MGYIYWELPEIPIPPQAYVNKNDGRVFLMSRDSRNVRRRKSIGHATGNGNMHPNDTFLFLFPNLWKEHYGEKQSLPPHMLSLGPYATFLAIAERNGLYDLLHKHFGPLYGNAVMDYAMFSAADRSNSAHLFEDAMRSPRIDTLTPGTLSSSARTSRLMPCTSSRSTGSNNAPSKAVARFGSALMARITTASRKQEKSMSSGKPSHSRTCLSSATCGLSMPLPDGPSLGSLTLAT